MKNKKNNQEIAQFNAKTLDKLEDLLNNLTQSGKPKDAKADKISQWVDKWVDFLKKEEHFNSKSIPALKRGSIIYANFGFNVGREYGGFHYGIVLNKRDSRKNHLLQVIPLTSVKDKTDLEHLKYFQHNIDKEIYSLIMIKSSKIVDELNTMIENLNKKQSEIKEKQKK